LIDPPNGISLGKPELPAGKQKQDENFGAVAVFYKELKATIPIQGSSGGETLKLTVTSQGCADAGLCYPPQSKTLTVQVPAKEAVPTAQPIAEASNGQVDETSAIAAILSGSSLSVALLFFFVAGLGLSLTPCILPMIPILSGIIVGRGHTGRWHNFGLSLAYVLGMATTYAIAGVAAGLTGTLLSAALQNIWVLGSFALIFVALAFSMFGFYELQLPASLQGKLSESANRLPGGQWLGLFGMGALSALIVGPCVAAPLAGALLYIGQTGNAVFGGTALFVMALGMGVPLLLVGLSAGTLLPKAGPWMEWVKRFFGVLLLATAAWLVYPVLPTLLGSGTAQAHRSALPFERIRNVAELEQYLKTANKPVMLDFYADWCVSCKEMEKFTFTDARVQNALKDVVLLQADVTANNPDDTELLKRFDLFGPPGIIFFDLQGKEQRSLRVVGYKNADEFLGQLQKFAERF
jgi:thioredoxin:protein disulfide reductase